jgi:hypothetical protein
MPDLIYSKRDWQGIGGQQLNDTLGASISGHLLRSPRFIELCSCRVPIRAIEIETGGKNGGRLTHASSCEGLIQFSMTLSLDGLTESWFQRQSREIAVKSICAVTLGIGLSSIGTVSLLSTLGFTVICRQQVLP